MRKKLRILLFLIFTCFVIVAFKMRYYRENFHRDSGIFSREPIQQCQWKVISSTCCTIILGSLSILHYLALSIFFFPPSWQNTVLFPFLVQMQSLKSLLPSFFSTWYACLQCSGDYQALVSVSLKCFEFIELVADYFFIAILSFNS